MIEQIVVVGATGYLGRHVADAADTRGHRPNGIRQCV